MAKQCRHLKSCNAMLKFQNQHGRDAGDVTWKNCEMCPLQTRKSVQPEPPRTQRFRGENHREVIHAKSDPKLHWSSA